MGTASAVWYGAIAELSYHAGTSWDAIQHRLAGVSRTVGLVAAGLVVLAALVWLVHRQVRRART